MPLAPDQLSKIIEIRDEADKVLRRLADSFALADLGVEGSVVEAYRVNLAQSVADALHRHTAQGQPVADPPVIFQKGTTVHLTSINGQANDVVLVSDYRPGGPAEIVRREGDRPVTVSPERIQRIEAVG